MDTFYTHLHCHSNFSMHNGVMTIDDVIEQAVKHNMKSVALTDINNICGSVEFFEKARMRGVKPLIGAEIQLTDGSAVLLLVKNKIGYANLCRLLTMVNLRDGHNRFNCKNNDLLPFKEGLILLSGGKRGRISILMKERNSSEAGRLCRFYRDTYGEDFYVELNLLEPDDKLLCYQLTELAAAMNVRTVAANDVFLPSAVKQKHREVLLAVGGLTTVSKLKNRGYATQYFRSVKEMDELFKRYPEALRSTGEITAKCKFEFSLGTPIFPDMKLPEGETAYSLLWKTAFTGMQERYKPLTNIAMKRLEYELNIINGKGFNEYFLIAKDIVDHCAENAIPCVGRGSAADSLVSYVLGITQVDPIRFDLYFERFLNPERSEPPDIDLDICWKSRDGVINYIYNKYGKDKAAMICTFNTFQLRSSVRDIGKAHGIPEDELGRLTKNLPHRPVSYLGHAMKNLPECKDHPLSLKIYEDVLKYSVETAGFPRHLSVHSGGIVIAPGEIAKFTALEISGKGMLITQHDMRSIEKLGLVKMDVLGVRGLSVIADCMRQIGWKNMDAVEEGDEAVLEMIMSGKTVGCFQLESPAMRGLLKKMQITSLVDIIAAIAVIRPGSAEGGMKDAFIRRRAGKEKITYPHPRLEPILKETYGVVVYQEQVLKIAVEIAGFSFAQSDLLRRSMTKSRSPETIAPLRKQFVEAAKGNNVSEAKALEIWQFLENFVGYGFNKAHSATYGLLAYRSAYLKKYYPVEFMMSVLNNGGGFYSLAEYIEESRRLGLIITPPDVNKALHLFTSAGNTIIAGFYPVYGLSRPSINKIIITREENGNFENIYDFLNRAGIQEKEALNLTKAGALRSIHESEPEAIAIIKVYHRNKRNSRVTKKLCENLKLPPYTLSQRIIAELESLSFAVTDHPLALFPELTMDETLKSSLELENYKDKKITIAAWMVTSRRAPTSTGEYIKFATMEDKYGLMEVVMFPEVNKKYGMVLRGYGPFKITGTVQSRVPGESNLIAEHVTKVKSDLFEKSSEIDHDIFDKDTDDKDFWDVA